MKTLGVGIIGCGNIAPMHVAGYARAEGAELRAVCSGSERSARAAGERWGVPWYTDWREMMDRGDIDIVSVCTPSGLHMEPALEAARRGIHVLAEKPLEITGERIDAMIAAAREHGTVLSCIFNNRFTEAHRLVKRAVDEGRFGKILTANASVRWYRTPEYYAGSAWRGTWALDGGGALMNQSIHYVDLLLWIAGDARRVSAYTGTLLHTGIEAEDTAVAAVEFANGALGTITGTTSTYPGYPAILEIAGERGSCVITDGKITAWAFADEDPIDAEARVLMAQGAEKNNRAADPMAFAAENHCRQIADFVAAIREGREPAVSAADARRSVALIRAIYRSAKSGQSEEVR